MRTILEVAKNDKRLKANHLKILDYIANNIATSNCKHVYISSEKLGELCNVTKNGAWRYIDRLVKLEYIETNIVYYGEGCGSGRRCWQIQLIFPSKNLTENLRKNSQSKRVNLAIETTTFATEKPQHNISILNQTSQSSHMEVKPKNTTVQQMLAKLNEITGWEIRMTRNLARWLYKAFQQFFHNIENWVEYLKSKIYDAKRIHNRNKFIFKCLLKFSTIIEMIAIMQTSTATEVKLNMKEIDMINPIVELGKPIDTPRCDEEKKFQLEIRKSADDNDKLRLSTFENICDRYYLDHERGKKLTGIQTETCLEDNDSIVKRKFYEKYGRNAAISWTPCFHTLTYDWDEGIYIACSSIFVRDKLMNSPEFEDWRYEIGAKYKSISWYACGQDIIKTKWEYREKSETMDEIKEAAEAKMDDDAVEEYSMPVCNISEKLADSKMKWMIKLSEV